MEEELIEKLLSLYISYTREHRSSIQPDKLTLVKEKGIEINFEDNIIRESLLEHVGHLPITAVAVYSYISNKEVDLGKALIMLSIHDISESKTGDIAIFLKTQKDYQTDHDVTLEMIDDNLKDLYLDFEGQLTETGKFAKSIDKMVADILDLLVPAELVERKLLQRRERKRCST
jgi:5'-deoxynucleotidase YfbR-like HD superfamily hydrolase